MPDAETGLKRGDGTRCVRFRLAPDANAESEVAAMTYGL